MGWVRDRNVQGSADAARQAFEDGLPVFITTLQSATVTGVLSGSIEARLSWSRAVAAIEAEGWTLEHWAVTSGDAPLAVPVFRRR